LNNLIKQTAATNPAMSDTLKNLIGIYNKEYYKSIADHLTWNGTKQNYNQHPYSCDNSEDVETIKKFESMVLDGLK
jgi:hypothetical protein